MSDARTAPSVLESDAERARSEVGETIHELKSRFSPEAAVAYGANYIRGPGGQRLFEAVRDNPLAAVMALAGIGWLLYTANQPKSGRGGTFVHPSRDRYSGQGASVPGVMGDETQVSPSKRVQAVPEEAQPGTAQEGKSWQSRSPDPDSADDKLQQALKDSFPASDPPQPAQPGVTGWDAPIRYEELSKKD